MPNGSAPSTDEPIGTRLMLSTPAAITTSYAPAITPCAAKWRACCDDPHCRSTVVPGTESGKPAARSALRPDVQRLLTHLRDAAHDHVVDHRGVEVVAHHERVEHVRGEVDGVPSGEPAVAPPERGSNGVDDHGVRHGISLGAGAQRNDGRADSLPPVRNLDRSLGDGGMPLLGQLGVSFERYGEGWAEATWSPTELAGNPFGIVHGGVYGVIHDAAMNFAANSALQSGDRVATLDMSYQTRRAPTVGDRLAVRGEVVQLTRQVAYVESTVPTPTARSSHARWRTFIMRRKAE